MNGSEAGRIDFVLSSVRLHVLMSIGAMTEANNFAGVVKSPNMDLVFIRDFLAGLFHRQKAS